MNTRKSFLNKKELIKYLLDADSNAEEYILQIPFTAINSQKTLKLSLLEQPQPVDQAQLVEQAQYKDAIETKQPVHLKFIVDTKRPSWEIFKKEKQILSLKSCGYHHFYCFGQRIIEKNCSFKIRKISGYFFYGIGTDDEKTQKSYGHSPKSFIMINSLGSISAAGHSLYQNSNPSPIQDGSTIQIIVNLIDWTVKFKVDEKMVGSCEIQQSLKSKPIYPFLRLGNDGIDVVQLL